MIKFIQNKFFEMKYRRAIRRYLKPDEDFLKNLKKLFLEQLAQEQVVTNRPISRIYLHNRVFYYAASCLFVLLIVGSGTFVFAEKQNVNALHPFYPLKRLGETIKLELAPQEQKAELHDAYAGRRLDEIKQLTTEKIVTEDEDIPNEKAEAKRQQVIENLNNDFNQEIDKVFKEIDVEKPKTTAPPTADAPSIPGDVSKRAQNLCKSVSEKMKLRNSILSGKSGELSDFSAECVNSSTETKSDTFNSQPKNITPPLSPQSANPEN